MYTLYEGHHDKLSEKFKHIAWSIYLHPLGVDILQYRLCHVVNPSLRRCYNVKGRYLRRT